MDFVNQHVLIMSRVKTSKSNISNHRRLRGYLLIKIKKEKEQQFRYWG